MFQRIYSPFFLMILKNFFFFNFWQFSSTVLCSYQATMLNPRETKMTNIQFMPLFLRIQRGHETNSLST